MSIKYFVFLESHLVFHALKIKHTFANDYHTEIFGL